MSHAVIAEVPGPVLAGIQLYVNPCWQRDMPELVQGITTGTDMSLFGSAPAREVTPRWLQLASELGCAAVAHARQVHEARVVQHDVAFAGLLVAGDADGHATALRRMLLAVSVADCVPISIVAPERGVIALLHGGWRGVAAGILEAGVRLLRQRHDIDAAGLSVHFGPAICGDCFQVGAEVPQQLGMQVDVPSGARTHIDLRAHLAGRARDLGIGADRISISAWCTRCGDSPFYSHRASGCRNARFIENRRGSRFTLCALSRADPRFPRYPSLPVLSCTGFDPALDTGAAAHDPVTGPDPATHPDANHGADE
jgi:polyphenol oxidase